MKFIRCAAIELPNLCFTGKNHAECLTELKKASTQGFLIDDYSGTYFADRKEALEIAKKAKQIIHKHNPKDQLLSEDMVWDEDEQRFLTGDEI